MLSQIIQIFLSVFLVFLILIQSKGKGLSSTIGAAPMFYRSRRGLEKVIFGITIASGVLLILNSLLIIFLY